MDDEIRINQIRPWPADDDTRERKNDRAGEEDEQPAKRPPVDEEPEVKDGHIDTRVAPVFGATICLKSATRGGDNPPESLRC